MDSIINNSDVIGPFQDHLASLYPKMQQNLFMLLNKLYESRPGSMENASKHSFSSGLVVHILANKPTYR
jgi:hypothetical protein